MPQSVNSAPQINMCSKRITVTHTSPSFPEYYFQNSIYKIAIQVACTIWIICTLYISIVGALIVQVMCSLCPNHLRPLGLTCLPSPFESSIAILYIQVLCACSVHAWCHNQVLRCRLGLRICCRCVFILPIYKFLVAFVFFLSTYKKQVMLGTNCNHFDLRILLGSYWLVWMYM